MYRIFELCYSLFRINRVQREAEYLATIPFGVIVFFPVVFLLLAYEFSIFPFQNDTANGLLFIGYIGLSILSGNYILVKPLGYRKRVRERDVVIREYGWGRRIFYFVLLLVLVASFIWVPMLVLLVQALIAEI